MFQGLHATVTGDSHIKKDIVCQDSSGHVVFDRFGIAVVADGHGSARHFRSDAGSRLAVKITMGLLQKYMDRPDFTSQFLQHPDFILDQMKKQILMKWREAVEVYHEENPLSEDEKEKLARLEKQGKRVKTAVIYGSTLLAAVMAEEYCFGLVLGDGGFVVLDDGGRIYMPVEDKNAHANYTSSLCNSEAIRYFEHWYLKKEDGKAKEPGSDGRFSPEPGGNSTGSHSANPDGYYSANPDGGHRANPDGYYSTNPGGCHRANPDGGHSTNPDGCHSTNPDGGHRANPDGGHRANPDGGRSANPGGCYSANPNGGHRANPDGSLGASSAAAPARPPYPKAMFVSTDGLFKSFASDEDFLRYHGLLSQMLGEPERMKKSILRNFEKRTREGSGDDISIAFIYKADK